MTQALPLKEQLKALEQLQELDLKIDALKKKKSAIPLALKGLDDQLYKSRTQVDAKKNAASEIEKLQRQTQAAIDLNQDRLSRSSAKLESVANSQEYNAANKEIDQLKKMNSQLEEQMKKTNQDLESAKKDLDNLTEQFNKVQTERENQSAKFSQEEGIFDKEISSLLEERKKYSTQVEIRILSNYDRVRGARAGLGLVPAVGGRCKGCNMMVPPQLFNELQKGLEVKSCPSCHRILFVPSQPSAPTA